MIDVNSTYNNVWCELSFTTNAYCINIYDMKRILLVEVI